MNLTGIADPTSPAKNYTELIKIEGRTKKWITKNDNLITVVGHTQLPRSITGIEIEDSTISLTKWQIVTSENGNLKIDRFMLGGPTKLSVYKTV